MNYPAYPEYKDSGVEWLGEIPEGWTLRNPKTLFTRRRESAHPNDRQLTASQSDGVVYQDSFMESRGFKVVQVIEGQASLKHVAEGDYVISLRSFQGGIEWSPVAGKISPAYTVLTPHQEAKGRYFVHLLKAQGFIQELRSTSNQLRDGQSLGLEHFAQVTLPLPPPEEQQAIADFLDRETAKIDALIAKQEQLIATLREDRIATITHAVTKGLDPNAEMKDSGVEWLGEIPAGWKVMQLRHTVERIEQGVSPAAHAELADDGWGVLKSGCVNGGVFQEVQHKKLPDGFDVDTNLAVKVGDLLVCRASGSPSLVGSAAIVRTLNYRLILSDKIFRFVLGKRVLPRFLEWELNSRTYREQVTGAISGAEGLANNLPLSSLKAFSVTVPPIPEQRSIVEYLDTHCAKLDALIAKSEQMIGVLREYRSALITDAVTGKIDVRGAA